MDRDFSRSRAILIGNGAYQAGSGIPDIPAAASCVGAMKELLTGQLCGWPEDRITPLVNVTTPQELAREILDAVGDVQDVLLLYYVGHGVRTLKGQLALTVGYSDAKPALADVSAILYEKVAELLRCDATTKLVILDCCKAELANKANYEFLSVDIAEEYPVEGLYFVGASKRHEGARFPLDGSLTYFTENFIEVVKRGIRGPEPQLRLDQIFPELRRRLVSAKLPEPVEYGQRGAHQYAFARNAAYLPFEDDPAGHRVYERAADRLVEEAALLARLIPGGDNKARALAEVALVVAGSDPQQAEHLLDDAEHAARSLKQHLVLAASARAIADGDGQRAERIVGRAEHLAKAVADTGDRARALAEVALVVAGSDPQRAERLVGQAEHLAKSVRQTGLRARALAAVAQVVAGSDPQRAERIFGEAEQTAQSKTWWKWGVLTEVALAMASSDPQRAERIAQTIPESEWNWNRWRALAAVAEAVAGSDPQRAERIAQTIADSDRSSASRALPAVAEAVAGSDPQRAERIAQTIPDAHGAREDAQAAVALVVAGSDPKRAERIAQTIRDGSAFKALALAAVAQALAGTDPQRAERIAEQAESIAEQAESIDQDDRCEAAARAAKALALAAVAQVVASTDPQRAGRLLSDAERSAQSIEFWYSDGENEPVHQEWSQLARVNTLAAVAQVAAGSDPQSARRLFSAATQRAWSIGGEDAKAEALANVVVCLAHGAVGDHGTPRMPPSGVVV